MFNVEVTEISSSTLRTLANIESLLIEQNTLLKQAFSVGGTNIVEQPKSENKANLGVKKGRRKKEEVKWQ